MQALDVFLNGKRSYVQGTQLIARVVDLAAADGTGPWLVKSATFQKMTDRTVTATEQDAGPDDAVLGTIALSSEQGNKTFTLYDTDQPAPRASATPLASWTEMPDARQGPLTTKYDITGLTTGEDYLVAVVQIVKALHEDLADDVSDVWLTGFRSATIPFAPFPATHGQLDISFRRSMKGEEGWQTLMMTTFESPQCAAPVRAAVTFFFRSEQFSHVN